MQSQTEQPRPPAETAGRSGIGSSSALPHVRAANLEKIGGARRDRAAHLVLVVDDEPASRYATVKMLNAAGYRTLETGSGVDALAMAGQANALVLDVNLPDVNGVQVCGKLRADTSRRLPIILHSAVYADELHKEAGMSSGADAYLIAPLDHDMVIAALDRLLGAS